MTVQDYTVLTDKQRKEEFLLSEANGALSREVGILASGQKVTDGRVLKLSGGKLVVAAGTNIGGVSEETIVGIVSGDWDASATGTNADIPGVPYIAREAEVRADKVKLHDVTGGSEPNATTAVVNALKALNIVRR